MSSGRAARAVKRMRVAPPSPSMEAPNTESVAKASWLFSTRTVLFLGAGVLCAIAYVLRTHKMAIDTYDEEMEKIRSSIQPLNRSVRALQHENDRLRALLAPPPATVQTTMSTLPSIEEEKEDSN
jgi:prefoldin subunit 5